MSIPHCIVCNKDFPDWNALAQHIAGEKKGHKKGKRWAAKVLLVNVLSVKNRRKPMGQRTPLTDQEKENKVDSRRELSGRTKLVPTVCPKCKTSSQESLPIEYVESHDAWHTKSFYVKLCGRCQTARKPIDK